MRVLAFLIQGKLDGRLTEVPTPTPRDGEVRIKVSHVGICGSDLHYYFEGANGAFVVKEPLIPGHELSAVVDLDPSGEFSTGEKVTLHPATFGKSEPGIEDMPHLWPGGGYLGSASTNPHTQGAMSEYFIANKTMLRRLPDNLSLELAALCEPLGVALHATNIGGGVTGKRVLVSGSGPIGLMVIAASKILGATQITATDVLDQALDRAKALGATSTVNVSKEEIPASSFDIVFECSAAAPAVSASFNAVRRAGVIVQVGMMGAAPQQIAIAPLVAKEIQLRGTFRFKDEITDAIAMLASHPWIGSAISHTYSLHDSLEAFEVAKDASRSGKVLVKIADL